MPRYLQRLSALETQVAANDKRIAMLIEMKKRQAVTDSRFDKIMNGFKKATKKPTTTKMQAKNKMIWAKQACCGAVWCGSASTILRSSSPPIRDGVGPTV